MLVPLSGVTQIRANAMADRYMYLPGIGLLIGWLERRTAGGQVGHEAKSGGWLRRGGHRLAGPSGGPASLVLGR